MIKQSVSVAIVSPEGDVMIVQRPADDPDLPDVWGLPAASLKDGESWEDAVRRAAREKLGIELSDLHELREGSIDRAGYRLEMKLFGATAQGTPVLRDDAPGVTHYQAWRWGKPADLEPAARRGSLCCGLFLGMI